LALEIVRRIRGNVHGTIDVTALEDAVISHEFLQRLRRVRQLAFLHYVFPGATHSRFEHSLGVMQLAGIAWDKLKVNQRRIAESTQGQPDFAAFEKPNKGGICHGLLAPTFAIMNHVFDSDYNLQVLRLSGLLHDIGHPPFSHSGERFLPSWTSVRDANKDAAPYIREWLEDRCDKLASKGHDPSKEHVRHEVFSILMIERILEQTYRSHKNLKMEIDPRDIIAAIAPEIQPASHSPLLAHGVYKMLNELISGELDIDRMDYLLRDSRECGVVYGIFDAGRILDGLCMYQDSIDKSLHVAISASSLAAFEDYLRARQSMYLQVYFHKTSSSAEAMLQGLVRSVGDWRLPAAVEEYAEWDEYNIGYALLKICQARIPDIYERRDFECKLKDLLFRRRLWKRVYESVGPIDDPVADEKLKLVSNLLRGEGTEFEQVSSLSTLTRFQPRGREERSVNYLRLIKKDEFDIPRVRPIEDFAGIIDSNKKVAIRRIYVAAQTGDNETGIKLIKQKISQQLRAYLR
jgi:HD superfamily phosphohydrolase